MNTKTGKLGPWMLIALVTGNMVGSGAFLLPADLARIGSISLLSLVCTIVGALALAIVFARMSLVLKKNGGPYVYVGEALGEYMGFQTAYYYWVGVWVGNAAIVVAALGYIDILCPVLHNSFTKIAAILAIIWVPTLINIFGVRTAGWVQLITSIFKFMPLAVVGLCGWFYFHPEYLKLGYNLSGKTNFAAFSSAITLTLWLFIGVESATVPVESVENPRRNIPLATIVGTALAAFIYLISNTAIFGMVPTEILAQSKSPFAEASRLILGSWGEIFVALGAICACLGALNGWVLVAAQTPLAAAQEGLFPKCFGKVNARGTPVLGLIITSCCITLIILLSTYLDLIAQFDMLILAATTTEVVAYFYCSIAQIILSPATQQARERKKNLFFMLVAIIAAAYSFYAILGSSKEVIYLLEAFLLLTIPAYAIFRLGKGRTRSNLL